MSLRPWMPFYVADYLKDTGHLTVAEHGAYLLLIMRYWQDESLPSDERLIARYAHLSPEQWADSRDVILDLFTRKRDGMTAVDRALNGEPRRVARPPIPVDVRRLVFARDGLRCKYCGDVDGPFDLDHKLPWSRGGQHVVENLIVACAHCNRSKVALTADEFLGFDPS
jgi:hypothetical protein